MENNSEPEEGNLVLMVSPTTGRVLLVLSGGLALFSRIEFSGIEAVDTFVGQLNEELTAVKQLLGHRTVTPIADGYASLAIVEWEELLQAPDQESEDSSKGV